MKLLSALLSKLGPSTQYYVSLPGAIVKVNANALQQMLDAGEIEETDVQRILP